MSNFFSWPWIARDLAGISAAIGVLVTDNILTGMAQHWTVSILAAINTAVLLIISPTLKASEVSSFVKKDNPGNGTNQTLPIVPPKNS